MEKKHDFTVNMWKGNDFVKTVSVKNCSSSNEARKIANQRNPGYKAGSTTSYNKGSNAFPDKTKYR